MGSSAYGRARPLGERPLPSALGSQLAGFVGCEAVAANHVPKLDRCAWEAPMARELSALEGSAIHTQEAAKRVLPPGEREQSPPFVRHEAA